MTIHPRNHQAQTVFMIARNPLPHFRLNQICHQVHHLLSILLQRLPLVQTASSLHISHHLVNIDAVILLKKITSLTQMKAAILLDFVAVLQQNRIQAGHGRRHSEIKQGKLLFLPSLAA